jgi:hypothetical protein
VFVANNGSAPLTNVRANEAAGQALVVTDGEVTDRTGFSSNARNAA